MLDSSYSSVVNALMDAYRQHGSSGGAIVGMTLLLTIVLELWSLPTVMRIKQDALYKQGWKMNFINHLGLGLPLYLIAAMFTNQNENESEFVDDIVSFFIVTLVHSLLYYWLHKSFHEYPTLYQRIHKFHHLYNTHVPPSSANAVTCIEYVLAYLLPFLVGVLIWPRTTPRALNWSVSLISGLNLVVHNPKLEAWSETYLPKWWVSTHDHQTHHRKVSVHYASPTLNWDYLLAGQSSSSKIKSKN